MGCAPFPEKNFIWNVVFRCIMSGNFCPYPCQKIMLNFSAWGCDLVDVKDVLLVNSEYSVRIMGLNLISFLLHYCIVMQAIWCLKFWNMTKSGGGTICISVPTPNSGGLVPCSPVIYAHDQLSTWWRHGGGRHYVHRVHLTVWSDVDEDAVKGNATVDTVNAG